MRVGVLITARLGSTRLPRKHLLPVHGKPILQYLVDAINREFASEIAHGEMVVAIATSVYPENQEFKTAIQGCGVFAGSDENIPLRHLQAAESLMIDAILSVDGDDILCAPQAMRAAYESLLTGARFVKTEGLPLGMNISGYSTDILKSALKQYGSGGLLETGWGRVFGDIEPVRITLKCRAPDSLRFTLDYKEDYMFFSALLDEPSIVSGDITACEIADLVLARGLDRITQPIADEYWANFNANVKNEEARRNV